MSGTSDRITLAVGNTIAEMAKVADFVDQFCAAHGIDKTVSNDLNLCLDELLNNTISYGYEDQNRHSIAVSLARGDDMVVVEIEDDGRPFDPRGPIAAVPAGTLQSRRIGGLGRHFVQTLVDEMDYVRRGRFNVVKIKKRLPP